MCTEKKSHFKCNQRYHSTKYYFIELLENYSVGLKRSRVMNAKSYHLHGNISVNQDVCASTY